MEWYWVVGIAIGCLFLGLLRGSRYPLFFIDKGHRFSGVVNESAQKTIALILKENGIKPWRTFEAGITKQVIMDDKQTVIGYFLEDIGDLPKYVISIPVKDPKTASRKAWMRLKDCGFEVSIHRPLGEEFPFYLIKSNVFLEGGGIAFRLPVTKMPKPNWIDNPV